METLAIIALLALTGFIDGQAFDSIPEIWRTPVPKESFANALRTLGLFFAGFMAYFAATYFMFKHGIENSLIMTLVWFVFTIISLAIISGRFFELNTIDKGIALAAIFLVGLLYYRGIA